MHYVGDVAPGSTVRRMFDEISDGRIEWADMGEVYDRVIIGGEAYDLPKGRRNLRDMLVSRFPAEEAGIDGYFEAVRQAASSSLPFQVAKTLPGPVQEESGPMMRRSFTRWADRTTREVLEELTADQRLIAVLTAQFGDYGLPPAESSFAMHALLVHHYFRGGYYPVGGSGVIAESIIPVIESAGGLVLINAEVAQVVVEDGRAVGVQMAADGRVIRAPIVISDAGVLNTFDALLPRDVAEDAGLLQDLTQVSPSMAHLCLYLGFEETAEALRHAQAQPLDLPERGLRADHRGQPHGSRGPAADGLRVVPRRQGPGLRPAATRVARPSTSSPPPPTSGSSSGRAAGGSAAAPSTTRSRTGWPSG